MKKVHFLLTLGCFILSFAPQIQAEIFTWKDDKGKVHFSDKAPQDRQADTVQVEVQGSGLGLATKDQRENTRRALSRDAELAKIRERNTRLNPDGSPIASTPDQAASKPAQPDSDDKDRPPMVTDQMTDEECRSKYHETCEEVKVTLQENIKKCLDNRGGKRCHEFDYQMKRLMPLTHEDWEGIEAGIRASNNRMRQNVGLDRNGNPINL